MGFGFYMFLGTALLLVVTMVFMGFQKVSQGEQYTVERFGRYRKTLMPGPNVITPFLDQVTHKVDVREQVLDIPPQEVITLDNVPITLNGVAYYQVFDAAKAVYEVSDYHNAVVSVISANIRAAAGSMNMDDLLSKREELAAAMLHDSDNATQPWGIKVNSIRIKDIDPPANLVEAMTKQMKAEREKRAMITEAEGSRQAEIARAEGAKQSRVLQAEAEKEAAILKAQADHDTDMLEAHARREMAELDAQARELLAKAEANAVHWVSQAISRGGSQSMNYFIAQEYVKALRDIAAADNQRLIMMPLESSQFIGALSGIAEVAKGVMSQPANPAANQDVPSSSPGTPV